MKHMELSEFRDRLAAGTLTRRQIGNVFASACISTAPSYRGACPLQDGVQIEP